MGRGWVFSARWEPAGVRRRLGFTLVELLVVIGVVAMLLALLLPALNKARRSANALLCSANIRTILQGMQMYAAQNNGAIPGSAHTSARFIYADVTNAIPDAAFSDENCPEVVQIFDWASPVAKVLGLAFDRGASKPSRIARFESLRRMPGFRCPENEAEARPWTVCPLQAPPGPMVSYNTAMTFLLVRNNTGKDDSDAVGRTIARTVWNLPSSYGVKVTQVGDASRKIYIADGSRYSNNYTRPDYYLGYVGSHGGAFSDQGPATGYSAGFHRGVAAGNGQGGYDARLLWARHGGQTAAAPGGNFRFNAGFFDGHVESLDDLSGSDPAMWFPRGTQFIVSPEQVLLDVHKRFFNAQNLTYVVP